MERWAQLLGAALVDAEEAPSTHEVPAAIARIAARTGADPEALASAAATALTHGHASAGTVGAVVSGDGVLIFVTRAHAAGLGERALAHEMSNALTAIAGWARLVREAPAAALAARLSALDVAVADALETANALLERRAVERRSIDLSDLCRRIGSGLEPYAQARGVTLGYDAPERAVCQRPVVPLRAIVQNLLKNAIEASPRGARVELKIDRARRGLRVTVLDRGPGLGGPRRPGGHGVGLGVVSRLATEIGATVRFVDREGGGTEACVQLGGSSARIQAVTSSSSSPGVLGSAFGSLPAHEGRAADAGEPMVPRVSASMAVKRSGERARRRRILLVEDEPALAEMMRAALAMIDAEVTCVASGPELEGIDPDARFDAALVDLRLERGDPGTGLAALSHIVERRLATRVVLTSGAPPETLPDGVDVLLPKPFDLDGLLCALAPSRFESARARATRG